MPKYERRRLLPTGLTGPGGCTGGTGCSCCEQPVNPDPQTVPVRSGP